MLCKAVGVSRDTWPAGATAERGADPAESVCAGGSGAPFGPRAGWFCWRAMAVMELIRLESDAVWESLADGALCPAVPKNRAAFAAAEAVGATGRGLRGPVGAVYVGRPGSADAEVVFEVEERGIVLPVGREVALSSE